MKYVLDANAAIAALNDVGSVRARLAAVPVSEVGIPIVAVAELLFGACKSSRREENLARIAALKRAVAVLPLSDRVADLYGQNRAALENKGIVKSDFDLLIACTALEQDAILVTSDRGLLDDSIPSLRAENWLEEDGPRASWPQHAIARGPGPACPSSTSGTCAIRDRIDSALM